MALGHIGSSARLTAFATDGSKAGRVCRDWYAHARDHVIERGSFDFTRTIAVLALLPDTVPGWAYAYQRPADCLFVEAVCDAAGARTWARALPLEPRYGAVAPPPFGMFKVGTATAICTDVANAYAVYRARVEDSGLYAPTFVEAVAWQLAADIAGPMEADAELMQYAAGMAERALALASMSSLNQSIDDQPPTSPSIRARG